MSQGGNTAFVRGEGSGEEGRFEYHNAKMRKGDGHAAEKGEGS
jgi:hypothetical protein